MNAKGLLFGVLFAIVWALVDLYAVVYAERWVVQSVGRFALPGSVILVFLPKTVTGVCAGFAVRTLERRFNVNGLPVGALAGLVIYFAWKFFAVEIWIAPDLFAYVLAVGPYVAFFAAYLASVWIQGNTRQTVEGQ